MINNNVAPFKWVSKRVLPQVLPPGCTRLQRNMVKEVKQVTAQLVGPHTIHIFTGSSINNNNMK